MLMSTLQLVERETLWSTASVAYPIAVSGDASFFTNVNAFRAGNTNHPAFTDHWFSINTRGVDRLIVHGTISVVAVSGITNVTLSALTGMALGVPHVDGVLGDTTQRPALVTLTTGPTFAGGADLSMGSILQIMGRSGAAGTLEQSGAFATTIGGATILRSSALGTSPVVGDWTTWWIEIMPRVSVGTAAAINYLSLGMDRVYLALRGAVTATLATPSLTVSGQIWGLKSRYMTRAHPDDSGRRQDVKYVGTQ